MVSRPRVMLNWLCMHGLRWKYPASITDDRAINVIAGNCNPLRESSVRINLGIQRRGRSIFFGGFVIIVPIKPRDHCAQSAPSKCQFWPNCASAGNRTRVTSMATMYSATRPLMLLEFVLSISRHVEASVSRACSMELFAMDEQTRCPHQESNLGCRGHNATS